MTEPRSHPLDPLHPPPETKGDQLHPWREPYLLLLEVGWWGFIGLITVGYGLIHLLFAGLYLLDPAGIGGTTDTMPLLLEAFFFSVETMATIGYGALHPVSLWVHAVSTAEALTGLILVALITGLAFARFARTPHNLSFGPTASIETVEGREQLVLVLLNRRRSVIHDLRAQLFWSPASSTEDPSQWQELPLLLPRGLPLIRTMRLVHPLESGPLQNLLGSPTDGVLLVSATGVDATLERPTHAWHCYTTAMIQKLDKGRQADASHALS